MRWDDKLQLKCRYTESIYKLFQSHLARHNRENCSLLKHPGSRSIRGHHLLSRGSVAVLTPNGGIHILFYGPRLFHIRLLRWLRPRF